MHNLNIIIPVQNEVEYVKLCIQSIRMFSDIENLSIILIDNNSSDGLHEWAMEQTDIAYIQNDEEYMPYGQMINQVLELLNLDGNLLLLEPHFMLTPACLSRMLDTLYEKESIGAVGPVSNGLSKYQTVGEIADYKEAIFWSEQNTTLSNKKVMALNKGAILFRNGIFNQLGNFDENVQMPLYTIRDYCFRMIQNDIELKVCKTALLWDCCTTTPQAPENIEDAQLLEAKWGMHYFNSAGNPNLINMIQHDFSDYINILEVGCDCGGTLLEIKNLYPNANVYGSEINTKAAEIASHFATVTTNNIEDANLPYEPETFDYIIFGDVLEHLRDPYKTIKYCRSLLKKDGYIIASIPNLMHISVISDLLKGNFTYTETGLLDKTHIHLFTYNEIQKMFQSCGYQIFKIGSITFPITDAQKSLIKQLTILENTPEFMYEAFQYIICAKIIHE